MGFHSWKTSDTGDSISNRYSPLGALPVYLITPDNEKIFEPYYEGYGEFDGHDAYALLAKWNCPELCNGDQDHDRQIGLHLKFDEPEKIKFPLKFARNGELNYEDLEPSDRCEYQGFFYPPGYKRKPGRPKQSRGGFKRVAVSLPAELAAEFKDLGGSKWLQEQIKKAKKNK